MPPKHDVVRRTVSVSKNLDREFRKAVADREIKSFSEALDGAITSWLRNPQPVRTAEVSSTIDNARQIVELTKGLANPYQGLVAALRLKRAKQQLEGIKTHKLQMDAWPANIYLTKVLGEIMGDLGKNDECGTLTNLSFWKRIDPMGYHYLSAQEDAISRGMTLRRIFLLNEREASDLRQKRDESLRLAIEKHRDFAHLMRVRYPNSTVEVSYTTIPEDQEQEPLGHFAYIRRLPEAIERSESRRADEGCMVFIPDYNAARGINYLKFLFSRGSGERDPETKFYIDWFWQYAAISRELDDLIDSPAGSIDS